MYTTVTCSVGDTPACGKHVESEGLDSERVPGERVITNHFLIRKRATKLVPSSRVSRGEVVKHQWVKDFLPGTAREENVLARQRVASTEIAVSKRPRIKSSHQGL